MPNAKCQMLNERWGLPRKNASRECKAGRLRYGVSFVGGFSLIELLVVLFIFSVLGIVVARSLALSLKGSGKSESISIVKESVEYTASTMERLLRNATSVTCTSSTQVDYVSDNGALGRFTCTGGLDGYITSGIAAPVRITSTEIDIACTGVVFSCIAPTQTVPGSLIMNLRASHATLGALSEGAQVNIQTRVQLRSY